MQMDEYFLSSTRSVDAKLMPRRELLVVDIDTKSSGMWWRTLLYYCTCSCSELERLAFRRAWVYWYFLQNMLQRRGDLHPKAEVPGI